MSDYPVVLDIELLDRQGESVFLRDLRGHPVVLVFLRWLG
jgi:peroxiredoxin